MEKQHLTGQNLRKTKRSSNCLDIKRVSSNQLADSLQWVAYALTIVFLAQVIAALFPLAIIQPQWLLRVSGVLRGTASLPLLATALFMLANLVVENVLPSSNQLRLFRRIATVAAIGFLLLIPLQSYAALRNISSQAAEGRSQLNQFVSAANQIQNAKTEQQLRKAILAIPGGEQLANRPLGADLQTVKTALLGRIRPTVKRIENQLNESRSKAIENTFLPLARDGLVCLGYAIGFAGMGHNKPGKPNLLRRILKTRSPELQKEMGSTWPGLPRK